MATTPSNLARLRTWRIVLIVAVVIVYLGSVTPVCRITKDAALYVLLAKSIAAGKGLTVFGEPHVHVPPGYALLIAPFFRLPAGAYLLANLWMALWGLAAVYLSYRVLRELVGPVRALAMTAVVALSSEMHDKACALISDMPFMVMVLVAVWLTVRFARRGRPAAGVGGAVLAAGSIWVRIVGIPFCGGLGLGLLPTLWRRRKRPAVTLAVCAVLAAGFVASAGGFFWYKKVRQPRKMAPTYAHHWKQMAQRSPTQWVRAVGSDVLETGKNFAQLFTAQRLAPWPDLALFWVPVVVGTLCALRRRRFVVVCSCWAYLGSILLLKPVLTRYMLPFMPLLLYFQMEGVRWVLARALPRRRGRWVGEAAVLGLMLLMNLVVVAGEVIEWHSVWITGRPTKEWTRDSEDAGAFLREHMAPTDRFVTTGKTYALGLLSGRNALSLSRGWRTQRRSAAEVVALGEARGVTWWVVERKRIPKAFRALCREIDKRPDFERVYENKTLVVYRRRGSLGGGRDDE